MCFIQSFHGVSQGPILCSVLLKIFFNYIVDCCSSSELFIYADDGKLSKHILTKYDNVTLQK
jgi:hypothetical protein